MELEFERTAWRDDALAANQVRRIQRARERGVDLVAGLPELVRPGRWLVRLSQTTLLEDASDYVVNITFTWNGGTSAAFKSDLDESQAVMNFPDPTWGWITWRGPILLAQTNFEGGPEAYVIDRDIAEARIEERATWVELARAICEAPYVGATREFDAYGSRASRDSGREGVGVGSPTLPVELRRHLRSPRADAKSLLSARLGGVDLVLGLPDVPIDLWADRPIRRRVRLLVENVLYEAEVVIGSPCWCTFSVVEIGATGSSPRGFSGWASLAQTWPMLAAFETRPGLRTGWVEAAFPDVVSDEDDDQESMSPARLAAVLRTLILAHDGAIGRRWVFGA